MRWLQKNQATKLSHSTDITYLPTQNFIIFALDDLAGYVILQYWTFSVNIFSLFHRNNFFTYKVTRYS